MDFVLNLESEEKSLVAGCLHKERWAQQKLYETYYGKMMGVCLRYSNGSDEAEDLLHEGFIKIFNNIEKYKPGTSLNAWVRTIMVNTCIDYYRKVIRRRTEDISTAYQISDDEPDTLSQLSQQEILAAVQQLSPTYRAVFNLYVMEGYSHKEIGEALDITESTSRSNLVKARVKLKEIFTQMQMEYDFRKSDDNKPA